MNDNDLETILVYRKRISISNACLSKIAFLLEYKNKIYLFSRDNILTIKNLISTPYRIITHSLSKEDIGMLVSFFKDEDYLVIRKNNESYEIVFYNNEKIFTK